MLRLAPHPTKLEVVEPGQQHIAAEIRGRGELRTTLGEHFGRIDVANLRRAHALLESGKVRGKIVLEGF